MTGDQIDATAEVQRLFKLKQEQRKAAKDYFQRLVTNPHRPMEAEVPFDPVFHRYNAMLTYQIEYYRPTPKNLLYTFALLALPIIISYKVIGWEWRRAENEFRTGKVPYEQRKFKLIE